MNINRGAPPALIAAISQPTFNPVVLVHFDWPGEPLRAHTGVGTITWGGYDWTGVGGFGSINLSPEQMHSGSASELTMSIVSDFPDIERFTNTNIKGRLGEVFMGATSSPGGNDLIAATRMFVGRGVSSSFRTTFMSSDEEDITMYDLSVTVRSGISPRTPTVAHHSLEDQRRRYPGDTIGRHLILLLSTMQRMQWPEP